MEIKTSSNFNPKLVLIGFRSTNDWVTTVNRRKIICKYCHSELLRWQRSFFFEPHQISTSPSVGRWNSWFKFVWHVISYHPSGFSAVVWEILFPRVGLFVLRSTFFSYMQSYRLVARNVLIVELAMWTCCEGKWAFS